MNRKRLLHRGFLALLCLLLCCSLGLTACSNDVDQESVSQTSVEIPYGADGMIIDGVFYEAKEYSYASLTTELASISNPPVVRVQGLELKDDLMAEYRENNVPLKCYPSSVKFSATELPQQDEWITLPGGNCLLEVPYSMGIAGELPRDIMIKVAEIEYRIYDLQNIYVREGHPTLAD